MESLFFNHVLPVTMGRLSKALVFSVWLYSLLLWFYIVLRILVNRVPLFNSFIQGLPFFSFFNLGILSFVTSFVALVVYLTLWGSEKRE
jgi:hypothetical protein